MKLFALSLMLVAAGNAASAADSVALTGVLGTKALLIINGAAPQALAPGDLRDGVKVISVGRDDAVVESAGARLLLRLGESPAHVGGKALSGGRRIVLMADTNGHFVNQGSINGKVMQFMVDTGATTVAMGMAEADRLGINYKNAQQVRVGTANGAITGWRIKLDKLRVQDVDIFGVDATITPQAMPYVLLGNSYLTQFQMSRINDQMVLEKRN